MDGHDKGAGGSADNLDNANNAGEAKGIFSTPDLTVNTENLPQNQPVKPATNAPRFNFGRRAGRGGAANSGSSERVATAFAQTDATQQSQRLNDAMLESTNAVTQSTATGDIHLDVPKKKKKWLLVVVVVAVVLAVAGGVATWILLSNNKHDQNVAVQAFNDYVFYLSSGPVEEAGNDSTSIDSQDNVVWFLFNLPDSSLSVEEQSSYITEIYNRYDVFRDLANEQLSSRLDEYSKILDLTVKQSSIMIYDNQLVGNFRDGGAELAYAYIQELTQKDNQTSSATTMLTALEQYLSSGLTMLEVYRAAGCTDENSIDFTCYDKVNIDPSVISNISLQREQALSMLKTSAQVINKTFMSNTQSIQNMLEEEGA